MASTIRMTAINSLCGTWVLYEPLGEDFEYEMFKAHHVDNHRQLAHARLLKSTFATSVDMIQRMERIAKVLGEANLPGIPRCVRLGAVAGRSCLITELQEGPTIGRIIEENQPVNRVAMAINMVRLMGWLHQKGIVHGRIRPTTFLLRLIDQKLALAEFGRFLPKTATSLTSRLFGKKAPPIPLKELDQTWDAPEVLQGQSPDFHSDLWSLGVLTQRLLPSKEAAPTQRMRPSAQKASSSQERPAISRRVEAPAPIATIFESMMQVDPSKRPENALDAFNQLVEAHKAVKAAGA